MMEKDLLLETPRECWGKVEIILPNIPSQRYVFAPSYLGERVGEEFIFTSNDGIPGDLFDGAIISVDDKGLYWIQNDMRTVERSTTRSSVYNTFVNGERLKALELRRLKMGDKVSFGVPTTRPIPGSNPIRSFCSVTERIIVGGSGSETDSDRDNEAWTMCFADSPLANNLILSEIMTFFSVEELKVARLVCRKWGEEGTKALEKRGSVSFALKDSDYLDPKNSTRVFRYLHEMRNMKVRNLHLTLYPGPPNFNTYYNDWSKDPEGRKRMDDLRKLLNSSHAFSSLHLKATIEKEEDLLPFATIFQELGGKLVELILDGNLELFSEVPPQFPVMTNLRKFTHSGTYVGDVRWVSLFVPLFSSTLEAFSCRTEFSDLANPYLTAFLEKDTPKLRVIAIKKYSPHEETLPLLLALKNPLNSLEFSFYPESVEDVRLLEELLSKHSKTLKTLVLRIETCTNKTSLEVRLTFPPFPNLEVLELGYDKGRRIGWEPELDYGEHFPSLRKIMVKPSEPWSKDDPVFNAFFPEKKEELQLRSETVKEVLVSGFPNPKRQYYVSDEYEPDLASLTPRMDQIRTMFPTAWKIDFLQYDWWMD